MSWFYLGLAGLFEIGWPLGLRLAQDPGLRLPGSAIALFCIGLSGFFMWLAQREIAMGTAYAIWTGIGAAGAYVVGGLFYGDPTSLGRTLGVMLIVLGVAVLKLAAD